MNKRNYINTARLKDDDEILFRMHRHPFGLITVYISTIVALGGSFGLIIWASQQFGEISAGVEAAIYIGMLIATVLVLAFLYFATVIYWASNITLTNDEVRQTLQQGLFSKKSSRLGLANVEDVTAKQDGFIASAFKFGTINIETAGEQSNFKFTYCPDPQFCANAIMEAREEHLQGEQGSPTRRSLR